MDVNEYEFGGGGSSGGIMSRIIYCSDLILRIDNPDEEINNITEWLYTSTEFRPAYPEGCVLRQEVGAMGKLSVIFVVWLALVVLTTFYCYFCEQRLFPRQKLLDWGQQKRGLPDSTSSSSLDDGDSAESDGSGGTFYFKHQRLLSMRHSPSGCSSADARSPSTSSSLLSLASVAPNSVRRERTLFLPSNCGTVVESSDSELKFREFRQLPADETSGLISRRHNAVSSAGYMGGTYCPAPSTQLQSDPYYNVYDNQRKEARGYFDATTSESMECLTAIRD